MEAGPPANLWAVSRTGSFGSINSFTSSRSVSAKRVNSPKQPTHVRRASNAADRLDSPLKVRGPKGLADNNTKRPIPQDDRKMCGVSAAWPNRPSSRNTGCACAEQSGCSAMCSFPLLMETSDQWLFLAERKPPVPQRLEVVAGVSYRSSRAEPAIATGSSAELPMAWQRHGTVRRLPSPVRQVALSFWRDAATAAATAAGNRTHSKSAEAGSNRTQRRTCRCAA